MSGSANEVISRDFCARKLSKNLPESSVLYTGRVEGDIGSPRAYANEDEDEVIPGGGGVGYAEAGIVR